MKRIKLFATAAIASIALAGCNSSSNSNKNNTSTTIVYGAEFNSDSYSHAVINMMDPGYDDSNLAFVDLSKNKLAITESTFNSGLSDFAISADGQYFYRLGRYLADSITKYSIKKPKEGIYTHSTLGSDTDSNPYDLLTIDDENAYLLRYGSTKLWHVNPSEKTSELYIKNEIDLSSYSVGDDTPEMSAGVLVDNKLYITLQNLDDSMYPQNQAKVIVLNTATNKVEKEIKLKTDNPSDIQYNKAANALFVVSPGRSVSFPASHEDSGIEKIDLDSLNTTVIWKGTDSYSAGELAIVNEEKAYIALYYDWGNSKVFELNLRTGELGEEIDSDISGVGVLGLAIAKGMLWASIADPANPRIGLYSLFDNSHIDDLKTEFNPEKIVFVEEKFKYSKALVSVKVTGANKDSNVGLIDLNDKKFKFDELNFYSGESNLMLTSYKDAFYRIGRTGLDTITKYSIKEPSKPLYTMSTLKNPDDESNGPYSIAFVDDNKAYVSLYASNEVLIFNPEQGKITDRIDISQYVDSDGKGEAVDALIIDDKLYVLLQNLARAPKFNFDNNEAAVLVIDTNTDKVINSIKLQTQNPNQFTYTPSAGLYVASVGKYMLSYYDDKSNSKSGLEKVSLDANCRSNCTELIVNGDELGGGISTAAVATANKAYISVYEGYGTESIRTVDLSTGEVSNAAFNGLEGVAVDTSDRFIVGGLHVHKGELWISVNETKNPRVEVFDVNTDEKKASMPIPSGYGPEDITFIHAD